MGDKFGIKDQGKCRSGMNKQRLQRNDVAGVQTTRSTSGRRSTIRARQHPSVSLGKEIERDPGRDDT